MAGLATDQGLCGTAVDELKNLSSGYPCSVGKRGKPNLG